MKRKNLLKSSFLALAASVQLNAQDVQFNDDFNTDTSSRWTVLETSLNGVSDATVEFARDYSQDTYSFSVDGVAETRNVPPNPYDTSGTTLGLKLMVNTDDQGSEASVSLFPNGFNASGNYALQFEMFMSYNGSAYGGSGSTEFAIAGINQSGTKIASLDGNIALDGDGVFFAVSGEGGASRDYRAYSGDGMEAPLWLDEQEAEYGFTDLDYDTFGEFNAFPGSPLDFVFPAPTHETPGVPGKVWMPIEIRQVDGTVTWVVGGHVIAEILPEDLFADSGNIVIGYSDPFSSIANPVEENYVIIDNVRVVSIEPKPTVTASAPGEIGLDPLTFFETFIPTPVFEGDPSTTFTITRDGDLSDPLEVEFTLAGTATAGADYEAPESNMVTIAAGATSADIVLPIINDQEGEPSEEIVLSITRTSAYETRSGPFARTPLEDDGDRGAIEVTAIRSTIAESAAPASGLFRIRFSQAATDDIPVTYTLSGTASNGVDFERIESTATIIFLEEYVDVQIIPIDNDQQAGDKSVTLTIQAGDSYDLGESTSATITLRDEDLPSEAAVVFIETFDSDVSDAWTINKGSEDTAAIFGYDYSADGIPPAPNTTDGSTSGLKFTANMSLGASASVTTSPKGKAFSGDYQLAFDLWMNVNGPLPSGGAGTTEFASAGIGTSGDHIQTGDSRSDGAWFLLTGEGGSSNDYRFFLNNAFITTSSHSDVYVAGSQNNTSSYYASLFPEGVLPPERQVNAHPQQSGGRGLGHPSFEWLEVTLTKQGSQVIWSLNGADIAIADQDTSPFTDSGNIFVGYNDFFSSVSDNEALSFGLVDNVRVLQIAPGTATPEVAVSRDGDNIVISVSGTLQSADTVTGPYTDVSGVSEGRLVLPVEAGSYQFYRARN